MFRLRAETIKKVQKLLSNNPFLIDKEEGVYLDTLTRHCENQNEVRLFFKAVSKCKGLNKSTFEEYFVNLITYARSTTLRSVDGLYNKEYISRLHGISLEQAETVIREKKTSKSTSLENFIARHGEEKGTDLFQKFVQTSNWRPEFLEKHGEVALREKNKTCTKRSIYLWMKRGYSKEDAIDMVSLFQRENAGIHPEYYRKLGYDKSKIDDILEAIGKKKNSKARRKAIYIETYGYPLFEYVYSQHCKYSCDVRSVEYFKRRYGAKWKEKHLEDRANRAWINDSDIPSWKKYKIDCWVATRLQLIYYRDKIADLDQRGPNFHLDHNFSIYDGFRNSIDPFIIGHHTNLRIISAFRNLSKGTRSEKTLPQLITDYNCSIKETDDESN